MECCLSDDDELDLTDTTSLFDKKIKEAIEKAEAELNHEKSKDKFQKEEKNNTIVQNPASVKEEINKDCNDTVCMDSPLDSVSPRTSMDKTADAVHKDDPLYSAALEIGLEDYEVVVSDEDCDQHKSTEKSPPNSEIRKMENDLSCFSPGKSFLVCDSGKSENKTKINIKESRHCSYFKTRKIKRKSDEDTGKMSSAKKSRNMDTESWVSTSGVIGSLKDQLTQVLTTKKTTMTTEDMMSLREEELTPSQESIAKVSEMFPSLGVEFITMKFKVIKSAFEDNIVERVVESIITDSTEPADVLANERNTAVNDKASSEALLPSESTTVSDGSSILPSKGSTTISSDAKTSSPTARKGTATNSSTFRHGKGSRYGDGSKGKAPAKKQISPIPYIIHINSESEEEYADDVLMEDMMSTMPSAAPNSPASQGETTERKEKITPNFSPETENEVTSSVLECDDCRATENADTVVQCCDGHLICAKCVEKQVKIVLSPECKDAQIHCPAENCLTNIPDSQAKKVLPSLIMQLLQDKLNKQTEESITKMEDLHTCPFCEFPVVIEDEIKEFTCLNNSCKKKSCRYCKKPWNSSEHLQCNIFTNTEDGEDETSPLPKYWLPMEENFSESFMTVTLDVNGKEYQRIHRLFTQDAGKRNAVKSIWRIQNPRLWQKYNLTRKHMIEDIGRSHLNEQQLFHGTHWKSIEAICRDGLDWRMCGENGTSFGQGTYFAKNASYSDKYCKKYKCDSISGIFHFGRNIVPLHSHNQYANPAILVFKNSNTGFQSSNTGFHPTNAGVQSCDTGFQSTNTGFQPTNTGFQQTNSGFQQTNTGFQQTNTGFQPTDTGFQQTNTGFQQTNTGFQQTNTGFQPTDTGFQPTNTGFQQTNAGWQSTNTGFQPTNTGFQPTTTGISKKKKGSKKTNTLTNTGLAIKNIPTTGLLFGVGPEIGPSQNHNSGFGTVTYGTTFGPSPVKSFGPCDSTEDKSSTEQSITSQMKKGMKYMFVARVLVGRFTLGNSGMRKPPIDLNDPKKRPYNSCSNHNSNPSIYVIFDSSQCYPEYLVEYVS